MEENTEEELNLLQSYLAPNSSESMEYFSIDFDKLSNEQIKLVISDWLPNQIIKIGPYSIYYLRKDIISPELWDQLVVYLYYSIYKTCRQKINHFYLSDGLRSANLMVLCFLKSNITDIEIIDSKKLKKELLHGVFVAKYGKEYDFLDKDEAFIVNTCFVEIKELKIKLGLFMRCLGLSILKNLGIQHIYTEALNKELVKYYGSLGFKMFIPDNIDTLTKYPKGKKLKCNDPYAVDQIDKMYKKLDIQNIIELVQGKDETKVPQWYMSICNFDETDICFKSFDSLRKELRKVDFDSIIFEKLIEKLNESNDKKQSLEERWTEGEKRLLELKEPKILYKYIKDYVGKRWPEGEKFILETRDPNVIIEYARDIIKGRWPEGEQIILESKNPKLIYEYARDLIHERWPEPERKKAEDVIINNPYASFNYAKDVIKGRWPEPERKKAESILIPSRYEIDYLCLIPFDQFPFDKLNQIDWFYDLGVHSFSEDNINKILDKFVKNKIWSTISKKDLDSLKQFIIELIPYINRFEEDDQRWENIIQNLNELVLELVNTEGGFDKMIPLMKKYKFLN
jgi:hypothetical protein